MKVDDAKQMAKLKNSKVEKLEEELAELKTNQTKLVLDLENYKSTDADLVISQQETKECTQELENEQAKNIQCQSVKKAIQLELESEIQKNRSLQEQNSVLTKSSEGLQKKNDESEKEVEELEEKIEELKLNQSKLVSDIENLKSTDADLVIAQQEIKDCTKDLDTATKASLQCHSENVSNLKMIVDLKYNQTKLESDLESFKSTDADLVISQQETKECNEDLEAEIKGKLQCESEKKTCEKSIQNEGQKNHNLQAQNSKITKSLEESRSLSSANQKLSNECQNQSAWSEWSGCSKTLCGIKTRIDRCSNSDDQIKSCNQDVSCPKSGKYWQIKGFLKNILLDTLLVMNLC